MTIAAIGAKYIQLQPVDPDDVPSGAVFLDETNGNALTYKTVGGTVTPINAAETSFFTKVKIAGEPIAIHRPVSLVPADGRVIDADSDRPNGAILIGYSTNAAAAENDEITVLLVGANLANALVDLEFAPGDSIYLSESGGYTNDPNAFTGNDDTLIQVGIADVPGGATGSEATDLITITDVRGLI